jgi:hypothetical protein
MLPEAGSSFKHYKFPSRSRHLPHFVGLAGSLPSLIRVLSHMNLVHTLSSSSLKIHFNIPSIPRSFQCSITFTFPNRNPVSISLFPLHATCSAYLIPLNLITIIIFDVHKWWSPSFCIFLRSVVTFSLTSAAPEAACPPHIGGRPIARAASLDTGHCIAMSNSVAHCSYVSDTVVKLLGKVLVLLLICLFVAG